MKMLIAIIAVLSAVLAACGGGTDSGSADTVPDTEITESTEGEAPATSADTPDSTVPGSTAPTADVQETEIVTGAKEDLAKRLHVDDAQVTVVAQEEIVWSDGSLGCPEEGMMYTQATVDGALLIVEVDGEKYEYHGAVGEPLSYCKDPAPR